MSLKLVISRIDMPGNETLIEIEFDYELDGGFDILKLPPPYILRVEL